MYERLFKLWYYTVTHGQMLLRSIGNDGTSNLDIYFGDVSYIEIPTKIDKIEILRTSQEDVNYITERIGSADNKITVLLNEDRKYYVVSSVVNISENTLGMFELPFGIPNYKGEVKS